MCWYLRQTKLNFDDGIDFNYSMIEQFSPGDQRQKQTAQKDVTHIWRHVVEIVHCNDLEKSRRDKVFLSPTEKTDFPLFNEAFEEVAAFWGQNGITHEINS